MNGYTVCCIVLAVALAPAMFVAATGEATNRLVGLELVAAIISVLMLVLGQVAHQSYFLAVPLVLVPLSLAGTLVFTRLLTDAEGNE
jgi:multisubunit Na+/H+ antiporter MnhF subunit